MYVVCDRAHFLENPGGPLMLKPMLTCVTRGFSNGPISEIHPYLSVLGHTW